MIKVNLSQVNGLATGVTPQATSTSLNNTSEHAPKVLAIFALTFILFAYEKYDLSVRRGRLAAVQQQFQAIQAEVGQYGSIRTVVDGLAKEKEKLNKQLAIIQKISQKRAAKLNTILQLQKDLPLDLWLLTLTIDNFEANFKGHARTPTSVQELVQKLNGYEFLEQALNAEQKRVKVGSEEIQEFTIKAKVKH